MDMLSLSPQRIPRRRTFRLPIRRVQPLVECARQFHKRFQPYRLRRWLIKSRKGNLRAKPPGRARRHLQE